MKKGNYGVDAPTVVIAFFIAGATVTIIGMLFWSALWNRIFVLVTGGILVGIGLYMIYSSKIGKYKLREKIIKNLFIEGNELVLDVGCGRGLLLNGLASRLVDGKAYGVDIWNTKDQSGNTYDAVMRNAAIEGTVSKIKVINSDMRKLPFPDKSFDVIVSSLAIHNLENISDRKQALDEISRVAKSGCRIAILDLARIKNYADTLFQNEFIIQNITRCQFQMFPPVRILFAKKPER